MANDSEKKRAKRNADALLYLRYVTLALHVAYILVRWILFGASFGKLLGVLHGAVMVVDAVVVYILGNWAKDGVDLTDPGLVEYLKDVVHLSWITMALALVTDYAYWVLLLAPLYAAYKAITLMKAASAGASDDDDGGDERRSGPRVKKTRQERLQQTGIETRGGKPKFSRR